MPPPYSAGSVFLQVVPSFAGVQDEIKAHAERYGKLFGDVAGEKIGKGLEEGVAAGAKAAEKKVGEAGAKAGAEYAKGFTRESAKQTSKELVRSMERAGAEAGEKSAKTAAGKFATTLRAQASAISKQVNAIKIGVDDEDVLRGFDRIQAAVRKLQTGKIGVHFEAEEAAAAMIELEKILDRMSDQAVSLRTKVDLDQAARDAGVMRKLVESVMEKPVEVPVKVDERQMGAFERGIKESLASALKAMPPIDLDTNPAVEKVERIRESLQRLELQRIGVDITGEQALRELALIQAAVQDLNRSGVDIQTRFDSAQLLAALDAAQKRVNDLDGSKANVEVFVKKVEIEEKASERLIGNFERTFKKSIEAALNNLPPLELDVDDASVSAEVDRIRRELAQLRDARLGIDLSSEEALAKLRALMSALSEVDGKTADVRVRSDISSTAKELGTVFKLVEALEKADAKVDVKADGAGIAATQLRAVNREAKSASGNGMDAANAFRAFNGRIFAFVALAPAAIPLLGAVAGGLAGVAGAALIGTAGLGVAALGFSGISDAVQGMNDVQENAATDAVSRTRQLRGAARGVRDAEQQLARAREDSAESVEDAERRVADAQRDAQDAQEDLIAARTEGARQLEDLSLRARGGALAERQAALDLAKAQADYISTFADGSSTNVEREEVAIALEREKLGYEQARLENQRLQEQQAEAARTGVEGTEGYQSALERVASANENVQDAERDRQRTQEDAAQAIADATQNLADAQEDYTAAVQDTGDVGSASARQLKNAMDDLGPAGQEFAKFLYDLKPYLKELRTEAQEGLLPGVQSWMESITGHHGPQLLRTVNGISAALGDVFEMWGTSLQGDAFSELFDMIEGDGPRWIREMGEGVTDIGEGFAYLVVAAKPFTDLFVGYFRELSSDFRDWASQVKGSTWLQDFFGYVRRVAPEAGEFIKEFFGALLNLLTALAPYGEVVMEFLTSFLGWVGDMDPVALGAIATGIFTLSTAMQAIFGLTSLVKSAEAAWRLATGSLGGFAGKVPLLAGGVLALVGGLIVLYTSSEDFRELINTLVGALADLVGGINDAVGPLGVLAVAFGGFMIARTVAGHIGAMRNSTAQLATAADMLGDSYGRATGKVGLLTKALAGAAAAAGGVMLYDQLKAGGDGSMSDSYAADLMAGGQREADLRSKLSGANKRGTMDDLLGGLTLQNWWNEENFGASVEVNFDEAEKKVRALLEAMNPLERAQYDVKRATDELAYAQDKYGIESDEATAASGRLRAAQTELETKQNDVGTATRTTTDALIAQANAQLAAADSGIAFEQATLGAQSAQEKYDEVMKDGKATAAERKQAELNLRSAYLQVAGAALRQAQDQAALRGETLTGTEAANAQLEALKTLAETMGGEVPEHIATLIADLEATAGTAAAVSGAVDGVTGAIKAVPGQKSVTVNALTDEAKLILQDLGIRVETFPDGSTTLTADDDPAQAVLDTFIAEAEKRDIVIPIKPSFIDSWFDVNGDPTKKPGYVGSPSAPSGLVGLPPIRRAAGGPIEGPGTATSDSVPILASDGEYMIRAASVDKYGRGFFDMLNAGRFAIGGLISKTLPRFATGGPVEIPSWNPAVVSAGADTAPIAEAWAEVITAIGQNTGDAAPLLAQMWASLRDSALGSVGELRQGATGEWTGLTTDLAQQTDTSLAVTEQRFRDMRAAVGQVAGGTRDDLGAIFGTLRTVTADPVNFVISNVLGAGLFTALNSVSETFGLDKTIPAPTPVQIPRLASGGRVPGFSPTPTADNIPALLTAREFVQPVAAVDYYGVDFMEAIRQRRLPKGLLPGYAAGGQVGTWRQLDAIRARLFPGSVMTSGLRPGARDHHGAGNAIDIGVPGNKPSLLAPIARRLAMLFPQATELINNPGGSIKNGRTVPSSFWGADTWAAHSDHVHFAMTAAALAAGALGSTDVPTGLVDSITAPIADLFRSFGTNPFTSSLAAAPRSLADLAWSSLFQQGDETGVAPTLYDDGGYLPPGLSMVLNATGKPEPVLTAEELELLRHGGGGGGGDRPYIGALTLPMVAANPHEAMDEVMHVVKVAANGGRYSEIGD